MQLHTIDAVCTIIYRQLAMFDMESLADYLSLQITVTRLYPDGVEPPPKRRQVVQQQQSPESQKDADINTKTIGAAEPVDSIQPESRQEMYAGLGLESSDEED